MPLKTFDEYVALAEQAHGHICAGQILGLRMALYGLKLLELDDPLGKHRKRLGTFIDRKSTRLNSSHLVISYAGFCVKKQTTGHWASTMQNSATATGTPLFYLRAGWVFLRETLRVDVEHRGLLDLLLFLVFL